MLKKKNEIKLNSNFLFFLNREGKKSDILLRKKKKKEKELSRIPMTVFFFFLSKK